MLVYRIFTIPRFIDFQIQSDTLLIEEIKVNAMNIEVIYVKGYFRPVIGIKPITDTLVPYKLCFSFLEDDEHKAMKQLKAWAEQNQIEVIYKSFSRWL
jgi:hypothetical protein